MKKSTLALSVLVTVASVFVASDVQAGLVDSLVNVSAFYPDENTVYSDPGDVTVVVEKVEYPSGSYPNYNLSWEVDITDTQMIITDAVGNGLPFGTAGFNGFILEMLDGPDIVSASIDPSSTIVPVSVTVVDNRVLANFSGVSVESYGSAVINIQTVSSGLGACCTNDHCVISSEEVCNFAHGSYQGDGSTCDEDACPISCPGDVNGDGLVNVNDLLIVIGAWGNCP